MNYAGKFDAGLSADVSAAHPNAHAHVATVHATHVPSGAIIVPDAQLLFNGDFKRSGVDLVLHNDDRELVLHDYFKGEKRAALASPDGAHLTGDIVDALTGHVQMAQADGSPSVSHVIGHVTKLAGSATAIRNGVSIILNAGDNVEKGDVIQSGSNSTVGITFIDGTVFGLSSNAKMVLNEMVYDPNGSNNSTLLSLVSGTITFVAGETAKHGDMKIDTPVATMGIRGTAVLTEIDFMVPDGPPPIPQPGVPLPPPPAPNMTVQVLVEPDGTTGNLILFEKTTLAPIATLNTAGQALNFSNGIATFTNTQLTPDQLKLINDAFALKFTDNTNTKSTDTHGSSFADNQTQWIFKTPDGTPITATYVNFASNEKPAAPPAPDQKPPPHIPGAPTAAGHSNSFVELVGKTGDNADLDSATGSVNFLDVNPGDRPTVSAAFGSFIYVDANGHDVTAGLNPQQLADIKAVEVDLQVLQDPDNTNNGSATLTYSVPDRDFDFLAAGEKLLVTYIAVVNNNYAPNPEITKVPVTFTITGTNDVPVITTGPQQISFAGGTTTPGGPLTGPDQTSGTLTFTDADLTDTHTVSASLTSAVLSGSSVLTGSLAAFEAAFPTPAAAFEAALTASINAGNDSTGSGTGTVSWQLADLPAYLADIIPAGQTLTLTYTVTVTDSQNTTSSQEVTVTITGTESPAHVWIETTAEAASDPAPGDWNTGLHHWETGTVPTANDDAIIITNQLIGLTPYYPVTINAAAAAKSVTMNDFGTTPPELDNNSTLTIGGVFDLFADSIVKNAGTISVGGAMEVQGTSQLINSGKLTLAQGGDFKDTSTISNTITGEIEVSGGTLNVAVGIANAGSIRVDSGAVLTLNGAAIDGGTVDNFLGGVIDLTGGGVLKNGTLHNAGTVNVSGVGNVLDNETVFVGSLLEVLAGGVLTIDQSSIGSPNVGTIKVDSTGTLILNASTITTGTITDNGTIHVTGDSAINLAFLNNGQLTVDASTTLTLDGTKVTGTTVTDNGTVKVDAGNTLNLSGVALTGGAINNLGTIDITGDSSISLDALSNTQLTIDATLTLNGTTVTGGIITDSGLIHVTGDSAINTAALNNGQLTVDSGATLTLDGTTVLGTTITDNGTVKVDAGKTLNLSGVSLTGGAINNLGTIDITGDSSISSDALSNTQLTIDAGRTLTLNGTTVTGGTITDSGAIHVIGDSAINTAALNNGELTVDFFKTLTLNGTTVTGTTITDNGTIVVDAGKTLNLSGVALTGGAIDNLGTVDITGDSSISSDSLSNTQLTIDAGKTLTLNGTTVTGGTVTDSGAIHVTGNSTINTAALNNGQLTVDVSTTLTLDGTTVTGTTITDNGTVKIDAGKTLTLNGTTVTGGTITDTGAIHVTGDSAINTAALNNGQLTVDASTTLTLDGTTVTGTTITDNGTVKVDAGKTLNLSGVALTGGVINNLGTVDIIGDSSINSDAMGNTQLTIDAGKTLTLNGTTVTGGTVTDGGTIHITGDSAINTAALNNGQLTVDAGKTLTLDGTTVTGTTITDNGTVKVDAGKTLQLNGVTLTGGSITDAGTIEIAGTSAINGAILNNGGVTVDANQTLTLDGTTVNGTVFTDTAAGAVLSVDAGDLLVLQNGATVNGGKLANAGTVEIETTTGAALNGVNIVNTGAGVIQVDPSGGSLVTLTLGDGTTVTNGTLSIGNIGKVEIASAATVALDGVIVLDGAGVTPTGMIQVDGTLQLNGTSISGGSLGITGTMDVAGLGNMLSNVTVTGAGTIEIVNGGVLKVVGGSISGAGSVQIDVGGLFEINGSDTQNVVFSGAGSSELQIDGTGSAGNALTFGGHISGLGSTDEIDLRTIGYGLNTTGTFVGNTSGGVLTITDGTHSVSMTLVGDYTHAHFAGSDDLHGGTLVTLNAADDRPGFSLAEQSQTGATITELPNTTGAAPTTLDPVPADSGTITFGDIDLVDRPTAIATPQSVTWTAADGSHPAVPATQLLAIENALQLTQPDNTNNGTVGWNYAVADSALDFLAAGETVQAVFMVTVNDHEGRTDTATVTINITGSNDKPVIAADTSGPAGSNVHAATEIAATTGDSTDHDTASGSLTFTDVDLTDTHTVSQGAPAFAWSGGTLSAGQQTALAAASTLTLTEHDSTGTGSGSVGFSYSAADNSFDFLAAGETLTITYNVTVADYSHGVANGTSSTQPVTITIHGANDAPVLAADTSGPAGSNVHAVSEIAARTGDSTDHDTASGSLTFNDVDLTDTHTVSQSAPVFAWSGGTLSAGQQAALTAASTLFLAGHDITGTGTGSVVFNYSAADNSFDFLAAGETLTITYNVTVADFSHGVANGTSSTKPVTITVYGANDIPTLDAVNATLTDTAAADTFATVSGTLVGHDADHGETATLTYAALDSSSHVVSGSIVGLYGALTVNSSGGYSYAPDANAINALHAGTYADTFTVQTKDVNGATGTASLTIHVNGANDTPTLAAVDATLTDTAAADTFATVSGTLVGHDADSGETATLTYAALDSSSHVVSGSILGLYGSLTVDSHGGYSYVPDANAINALQAGTYADTFTVQTKDVNGATGTALLTIHVDGADDVPVADAAGYSTAYTLGAAGVAIDPNFTVSDVDSTDLHGATIAITGNFEIGDTLIFAAHGNITGNYDPNTGVLTLTGDATVADYQDAIASISYQNIGSGASTADRTISYTVNDGSLDSTAVTSDISIAPASGGAAQTFEWNNPNGGDWDDAASWTPSGPPGATDNVVIDTASLTDPSDPLTITLNDATTTVADLTVSAGVKLDIESGNQLIVNGTLTNAGDIDPLQIVPMHLTLNGSLDNTGTIENQNGDLTIDGTMTGDFVNSGAIDAVGDLTISAAVGGDFSVLGIANIASEGGDVTISGPISGNLTLSNIGSGGGIFLDDGYIEASQDVIISSSVGGSVSLSDDAHIEADNGDVTLSGAVTLGFALSGDGHIVADSGDVKIQSSIGGDLSLADSSYIEAGNDVIVSGAITGSLQLTDDAAITADEGAVRIESSIGGDFSITSGNITADRDIVVSGPITGDFSLTDGGYLYSASCDVKVESSIGGDFTLSNDAYIEASNDIVISGAITGTLSLTGGGNLYTDNGDILIESSIGGDFTITDSGYIEANGNVVISGAVTGTFSIDNTSDGISADYGDLTIGAAGAFSNGGALEAFNGTITFNGLLGTFVNTSDGTLSAQQLEIGSVVGAAFENKGHVTLDGTDDLSDSSIDVAFDNTGTTSIHEATLDLVGGGSNSSSGVINVESGGVLDIESSFLLAGHSLLQVTGDVFVGTDSGESLSFAAGSNATIELSGGTVHGAVAGFASGDTIDFAGVASDENPQLDYDSGTGVLTLSYVVNDSTEYQSITLSGTYSLSNFQLSDDGHGGTGISYVATPTLVINEGPQTASVADGGTFLATGHFTATDSDNSALTWNIAGGSRYTSENYQFGIHEFAVTKVVNGVSTTVFDDSFDGTVPPDGPAIQVGSTPTGHTYFDSGAGTYVQGTGEALMTGSHAGYLSYSLGSSNYGDPVFGQFTTLLTGISSDTAQSDDGLRSGQSFSVSGMFDLTEPADNNTLFGIRLADRVSVSGDANQPGTEVVSLGVTKFPNGSFGVFLNETNYETGLNTTLQGITINPPAGDNEILLSLSHDAANNGQIVASYTLEKSDGHGNEVPDGAPVTFTAVGHIFDNEDWARAQFYSTTTATATSASPNADSILQGTYGQLDLAQNGTWTYQLNPALASVKALAAGVTAQDVFQVTATDAHGLQSAPQTVSVTVTGVNDAPVVTAPVHYHATPGTALNLVNTGLSVSDPDGGNTIETATLSVGEGILTISAGSSGVSQIIGNGTGAVTFSGSIDQINTLLHSSSGSILFNDAGGSPDNSTTLTLTVNDNGNNGSSALAGSASASIAVGSNTAFVDWHHHIDVFAASQGSATQWIVPNYDGLTSTVFNGGGITYDPISHLPTGGGLGSISLVENDNHAVLQTITGVTVSPGDFGAYIGRLESIQSRITWSGVIDRDADGPLSSSSAEVQLSDLDGTVTKIIGTNLSVSGSQPSGLVTSVEQLDALGNVLHTVSFTGGVSLGDLAASVFTDQSSGQFYNLMAQGNTTLTAFQSGNGLGSSLNDAPGNHTFVGTGQSFYMVDFQDATSGVTANLATGTASWGSYHDTLVNISGLTGSDSSADTLIGNNGSNFLDGNGAPSGGHDTLTGGGGSDTFQFGKGYGALTITDFDQGNGGGFNQNESDQIQLVGLSDPQSLTQVGANTVADFGDGDVITFLNTTVAQIQSTNGGGNGGGNNAVVIAGVTQPGSIQLPTGTPDGEGSYIPLVSSNNFTFTDADQSDTHTVGRSFDGSASNLGFLDAPIGQFTASMLGDSTGGNSGVVHWNFTLSPTDILLLNNAGLMPNINEVFDVTVDDGHGGAATQQIAVQIDGATLPATLGTVSGTNGPVSAPAATASGLYKLQGATVTASGVNGVSLQSTDSNAADFLVADADQASSISVTGGFNGVNLTSTGAAIVAFNAASSITATGTNSGTAAATAIGINATGTGNVFINDLSNTSVSGSKYGIAAFSQGNSSGNGNVAVNVYSNAAITGTASYGILAFNGEQGNISVTTSAGDLITSGSAGINAVNQDASIAQTAHSTIIVNASGTINSGSNTTNNGSQPGGILAGYLGGPTNPTIGNYPIANLFGTVIVNNYADINAAAGDGIRAYNFGTGDVTVNDYAGAITALGGSIPVNGYGDGISANNSGPGNLYVTTGDGVQIHSGSSGIAASASGPASPLDGIVSVIAHGTIHSGNIPTGSGNIAAGILAGYNYNSAVDVNDHGNVVIDDFASIVAASGTDGIRGYNYGDGNVTITVESGADVNGPRYGVGGFGMDGGNVTIVNHGSITGGQDAINATTTGSGTVSVDNFGDLTGNMVTSAHATVTNELGADWSLNGNNPLGASSTLSNIGTIDSNGTSSITQLSSISNTGTIEVHTGSLKLGAVVSGTGALKIDAGSTLELVSGASSGQTVTFNSTTGMLKLDNAQNFHGTVAGFGTTDGTLAHSDQIDLANINHHAAGFNQQFNAATDTLTVTDGTNTATIHFTGNVGTLNFADDGNLIGGVAGTSGTIVYDPPASTSTATVVANAPDQTLSGAAASNTFVFNFANVGKDTVTDFHPAADALQFTSSIFATAQAALSATHDDGQGNAVVTIDAHDTITLKGILQTQLHVNDFHIV